MGAEKLMSWPPFPLSTKLKQGSSSLLLVQNTANFQNTRRFCWKDSLSTVGTIRDTSATRTSACAPAVSARPVISVHHHGVMPRLQMMRSPPALAPEKEPTEQNEEPLQAGGDSSTEQRSPALNQLQTDR